MDMKLTAWGDGPLAAAEAGADQPAGVDRRERVLPCRAVPGSVEVTVPSSLLQFL